MIKLSCVCASYGKKKVLEGASFTAETSQITVILGKNGSGKSTLLHTISGSLPYSGTIEIENLKLSEIRTAARAKLISVMPQLLPSPDITVRELVSFGRQPYTGLCGILTDSDRRIIESAMKRTETDSLSESLLCNISGGEKQRAYFAMLIAQDTPNILLDEPGAHLDPQHNRQMYSFLKALADSGKTVITVMHDVNLALEIANKVIFVHDGKVIFNGNPTDFSSGCFPEKYLNMKRFCVIDEKKEKIVYL